MTNFTDLGLVEPLLRALTAEGYTTPTPIQAQAIPHVAAGRDLLGIAQTGTGKTAAFALPILEHLAANRKRAPAGGCRVLVLSPTRELASQIADSFRTYGKRLKPSVAVVFGGVGHAPQTRQLRAGVDVVVATPGRLLDHLGQRNLRLSDVEIFVLDEADRMLDMGFIHDIKKVLAFLPAHKQSLLFSATFSDEIKALADRLLNKPALIEVARRNQTADTIAQKAHPVGREMKKDLLTHLIKDNDWHQVLVFTRMKHGANRLTEHLNKAGITAMAIHGNKSQGARTKALADFKNGDLRVLVATDIAARGIDIDQLPHVVNYEMPNVPEDYVHRIGRTGRAGAQGEAISLVCPDENIFLRDIERLIKREIPKEFVPGFAPPAGERAEPIVLGRMVIGEGAGRGGNRHHAPPRGGSGHHAPARGGQGHGGAQRSDRSRNDGRPAQHAAPARPAHPAPARAAQAQAPAPAAVRPAQPSVRPDGQRGDKPTPRLTQAKPR